MSALLHLLSSPGGQEAEEIESKKEFEYPPQKRKPALLLAIANARQPNRNLQHGHGSSGAWRGCPARLDDAGDHGVACGVGCTVEAAAGASAFL